MYGMKLEGKIRSIGSTARDDDGTIVRADEVTLCFEFTKDFASGIGEDFASVQQLLRDGAMSSAAMPLDAGELIVSIDDGGKKGGKLKIVGTGAAMRLKGANKEDANPQAALSFSIPTKDEHHMWLVHHLQSTVDVQIEKRQGELDGIK